MTTIVWDNIPQYLRDKPRWTVWLIPDWNPGTEKPKKILRLPSGESMPEKYEITKNTGTFSQVREACSKNPRFYPGFWIEKSDGLIFMDYDGKPGDIPAIPQLPSYCEKSAYGYGYHILGWYQGEKPKIPEDKPDYTPEIYQGGRWIIITGSLVDTRRDINDLTDYLKKYTGKKGGTNKFRLPDNITEGERNNTLHKYASSMRGKGSTDTEILDALVNANRERCHPPLPEDEVKSIARTAGDYPAGHKNGRKNDKEIPEYTLQQRGWFERAGNLYIEVIDSTGDFTDYSYAVMDNGKITFIDDLIIKEPSRNGDGKVELSGLKYIPRSLPVNKDGQPILMVGIPEKRILESITTSDIGQIKTEIENHIRRYCELSPNDLDLCVYYILTTWFYSTLSTVPYLRFRADTGKGKSRILKVVSDLCFYPVKAGGASTASGTIRFAEYWHGTIVIDEADIKGEADDSGGYTNDMIKYLNLGFERGQYFIKSDKTDPKRQEVFDPFCPKVIAMRGVFQDPATEGRCLSISPPETERADIPAILPAEYDQAAGKIRAALAHYTLTHWGIVSDADPYPSFNDVVCEHRLKQLGGPLAKVLSKILPDGMVLFKHYIEQRQLEVKADRAGSFVGSVVNILYDRALDSKHVYAGDIADDLSSTPTKVSRTLKDAGISIEVRDVIVDIPATQDKPARTRTISKRVIAVKNARAWREVVRRYIVMKGQQGIEPNTLITCPVSIRSNEYVEN